MELETLRFPVGKYHFPEKVDLDQREEWINEITLFPGKLEDAVKNLSDEQLNWRYRPDGWTIKQVVHHCADSHINAFLRFKLALTEDNPTIKPYKEGLWANLDDNQNDVDDSIMILKGLHKKWAALLNALSESDLQRTYIHPEHGRTFNLEFTIGMYAWHSRHHHAHVLQAIAHKGEFN